MKLTGRNKKSKPLTPRSKTIGASLKGVWHRYGPVLIYPLLVAIIAALIGGYLGRYFEDQRHSTAQIELLIYKEADLASREHTEENLKAYGDLFAENAQIISIAPKKTWDGREHIIDRIRPLHFNMLKHHPTQIVDDVRTASAETDTVFEQDKPTKVSGSGKESWRFLKTGEGWKIRSLEYGR